MDYNLCLLYMKYQGGKYFLSKDITRILLEKLETSSLEVNGYVEPFCGALNVMCRMSSHFDRCYAYDIHEDLIALWKEVKADTFIPPPTCDETNYLFIKHLPSPNAMKAFVGFGLSFGGKYFSGYAPRYKGDKKEDYLQAVKNSMLKIRPHLNNVEFECCSYDTLQPTNKLIYCDPPYKSRNFPVKYRTHTKKYDLFDTEVFWEVMRKWSKKNIVVVSELQAPDDFVVIFEKKKYRSASQSIKTRYKNDTERYVEEKLFMYKGAVEVV